MKAFLYLALAALFVLHHDFWWWDSTELLFGFLPVGLAWHALFSVLVAGLWALAVKVAWPAKWETWADETEEPS